ncbi:MAG: GtrA family protein [Deltaproteobacteria bacterium]|jgi:putative flippase GtrA|nr:GtrA family protein [Deltaproteobacteria bacterium]
MLKRLFELVNSLLRPDKSDNIKGQAFRQIISGFTATVVDLAVFKLELILGVNVLLAALVSAGASTLVNFTITKYYVYSQVDRQKKRTRWQFILYIFTVLVSIGLTQLILLIFSIKHGFDPFLVKIGAVPFVYIWTVLSGKYIVFNKYSKEEI